ncbi:MAG: histidinol dehydrogenase [Clostridia bacterium]|nr:histidinol dehydrogenase [Clostridia bacterium]
MNIYKYSELSKEQKEFILKRAEIDITSYMQVAKEVSDDVKANGDAAVLKYTEKFDKISLTSETMKVTKEEIEEAFNRIDATSKEAITYAYNNIRTFHEKQKPEEMWMTEVDKGILAGEKTTPIESVCLYVPGGKGSFPSVLLMLGVPAVVAGVEKIVVVTPPNKEGKVDDAILTAAKLLGITEIFKVGGIQAIAAVAFGTETIPKTRKVIGPGNAYATAAKRVLANYIDTGLPAGPSESIILCDDSTDPKKAALDWLIEAEHGPDSAALLVCHNEKFVQEVVSLATEYIKELPELRQNFININLSTYGGAIITDNFQQSVDFVNEYAPEHMEVLCDKPFDVLPKIKNAGEILLGEWTPVTLCNFLMGPNAILPTGGFAKTYSSVGVLDFMKRSSFGYVSKDGFLSVKDKAGNFAELEGFAAHAMAVRKRPL